MADNPQDPQPKPSDLTLPLDELLALASIDEEDVQNALDWWRAHASKTFEDVLDVPAD